jgi:hypothetical protein
MKNEKSIRAKKHKGIKVQKGKINLCTYALMAYALTLAGCTQQQKFEPIEKVNVPDINKAEAFAAAEDVLADMHFTIEKSDYESGIIKTRPLPGAQFFEFWRSDNAGAFNTAEANLHSIRRIVELHINRYGFGFSFDCDVRVQRLTMPALNESDKLIESPTIGWESGRLKRPKGAIWLDLGKDTKLATKILNRIQKHIITDKKYPVSQASDESRVTPAPSGVKGSGEK